MNAAYIDLVRGLHLLFLALGMGSALYLDARILKRMNRPFKAHDFAEMRRIHTFVSVAFAGLWISGLYLVWIRTGFDLALFSPKLWCKLLVVSIMTLNAFVIGQSVLPAIKAHPGRRLIDIPSRTLLPLAVVASLSMFCWLSALALGSSHVLKTAPWDALSPLLSLGFVAVITCGVAVFFCLRTILLWLYRRPDPFDRLFELSRHS